MSIITAKTKNILRELLSWALYIGGGFLAAMILSHTILVNAEVTSGSMEKTIMTKDHIAGLRVAYLFGKPERLDIVVFTNPIDPASDPYVKRIIGLPGDTVNIRDNQIYINNAEEPLDEPYIAEPMKTPDASYAVPEGHYFMMGDNRNRSTDSRFSEVGFIPYDDIIGKVYIGWFPNFRILK